MTFKIARQSKNNILKLLTAIIMIKLSKNPKPINGIELANDTVNKINKLFMCCSGMWVAAFAIVILIGIMIGIPKTDFAMKTLQNMTKALRIFRAVTNCIRFHILYRCWLHILSGRVHSNV